MEVFGGVFVFRRITATHVAANQAHAQMDPTVSHLYALIALVFLGFAELDLVDMDAFFCHDVSFATNHSPGNDGSEKLPSLLLLLPRRSVSPSRDARRPRRTVQAYWFRDNTGRDRGAS